MNLRQQIFEEHRSEMQKLRAVPSTFWQRFRAEERLRAKTLARLRALDNAEIELKLERDTKLAESLKEDPAMIRVVRKFNGRTQYGWERACGNDGRLKKAAQHLGWECFSQVIWEIRKELAIWPAR